jgi:hypothetical protein
MTCTSVQCMSMVYGVWCMVYGVWCMVYDAYSLLHSGLVAHTVYGECIVRGW